MRLFGSRSASACARRRGAALLHSTHLYKNLVHILNDNALHSAGGLRARHGSEPAARFLHDPRRYERYMVGLDYLNASLSVPNVELLYQRSKSEWKSEWIHLELDLELLDDPHTLFCPVSAATDFGKYVVSGPDGFAALFVANVNDRTRAGLPKAVPTHPQAEVLLRGPLALGRIRAVHCPTLDVATEARRLCERCERSLSVQVSPHLYVWPPWVTAAKPGG